MASPPALPTILSNITDYWLTTQNLISAVSLYMPPIHLLEGDNLLPKYLRC